MEFFLAAMFRLITDNMEDKWFDSWGTLFQSEDITLKNCKIELTWQLLPLFMKPMEQIELVFETVLMLCFRYGLGDGELLGFFQREILWL